MTPERVRQHSPQVLDQRQREQYFEDGFLAAPGYVGAAWRDRLRAGALASPAKTGKVLIASSAIGRRGRRGVPVPYRGGCSMNGRGPGVGVQP